jgi:hypothetical protein
MINYPTSLDTLTNPTATDPQNNPSHSEQHANANDAIEALQAKVGVNGSAVTTSHEYKISSLESAYQIVPSVSSNNLTVALKTLAGNDPSASDPVRIRIGNTIHSITSALSVTKNAGTNWCNAGSAELATQLVAYFVYLGYNATDGVTLGFSRIPYGALYSDFSATTTNEKYCAISTITNATAGDNYANIGYFEATLSAGAGYTWSVPTFNATNLVNRPIYETSSIKTYTPTLTEGADLSGFTTALYRLAGRRVFVDFVADNKNVTSSGVVKVSLPFSPSSIVIPSFQIHNGSAWVGYTLGVPIGNVLDIYKSGGAGTWAGSENGVYIRFSMNYEI